MQPMTASTINAPPVLFTSPGSETPTRGLLLGFFSDEHGELIAVIGGVEGHGMMLQTLHPSRVRFDGCGCKAFRRKVCGSR